MIGISLISFGVSNFLEPGTLVPSESWWVSCLGLAFFVFGGSFRTQWQAAGILAALYVAGFSAQLAVKDPFWFQHIRVLPTKFSYGMMLIVAMQGIAGGIYLLRHKLFSHICILGRSLGWVRLALVALILVGASKAAMDFIAADNLPRYAKQLIVSLVFLGCNLANLAALVVAMPAAALERIHNSLNASITLPKSAQVLSVIDKALPYLLAVLVFSICVAISLWSFDGVPHLDGIVYLFHARYFAEGMVALPVLAVPEAFDHYLMDINGDKWFSVNLPGWPAAMAVSLWFGAPWLLNPVLAAVSVLLLHRFLCQQTDRGTANLVTLLLAVSPWYLSMSSTMLLHTFTYALVLGAWVLLQGSRKNPNFYMPFIAGCLMGWLFLARPLEGVYIGVLTGLWTLTFLTDRQNWRTVLMYGFGCIAVGILLFFYNAALTGSATALPMDNYLDRIWGPGKNAIGFGADKGAPDWGNVDALDGHSPWEALINFQQNLYELNSELLGWAGASVFFAVFFLFWGRWSRFTASLAIIVVVTVGLYSLYWYVGGFYTGPRYWFMTLVPLLVFSAMGIVGFAERMHAIFPHAQAGPRIGALVCFLGLTSILIFESWVSFNKFPDINGYHADYQQLSRQPKFANSLIFINPGPGKEFGSAFWLNDFSPASDTPLFARDLGRAVNRQVASQYPDRAIYYVDGRSGDRPEINVRSGPISHSDME